VGCNTTVWEFRVELDADEKPAGFVCASDVIERRRSPDCGAARVESLLGPLSVLSRRPPGPVTARWGDALAQRWARHDGRPPLITLKLEWASGTPKGGPAHRG